MPNFTPDSMALRLAALYPDEDNPHARVKRWRDAYGLTKWEDYVEVMRQAMGLSLPTDAAKIEQTFWSTGTGALTNLMTADASRFEATDGAWASLANLTMARSTAFAHSGSASLRTVAASTASTSAAPNADNPAATAATNYVLHGFVLPKTASRDFVIGISWYTAAVAFISSSTSSAVTCPVDRWTPIALRVAAPALTAFAQPFVTCAGAVNGDVTHLDDFHFYAD